MGQSTSLSHAIEQRDGRTDKIGEVVELRKLDRTMSQKLGEKKAMLYIEALNDECLPIICAVDKFSEFLFDVQKVTVGSLASNDRYGIEKKMKKHLHGEYLTQLVKLMEGVVDTVLDTQTIGVVEDTHTHVVYANMSVLRIDYYLYFTRFSFGGGEINALFYYVQVGVIDMMRVRLPVLIYELTRATDSAVLQNAGNALKGIADSSIRLHEAAQILANAARQTAGNSSSTSSTSGQPSSTSSTSGQPSSTGSTSGQPSSTSSTSGQPSSTSGPIAAHQQGMGT